MRARPARPLALGRWHALSGLGEIPGAPSLPQPPIVAWKASADAAIAARSDGNTAGQVGNYWTGAVAGMRGDVASQTRTLVTDVGRRSSSIVPPLAALWGAGESEAKAQLTAFGKELHVEGLGGWADTAAWVITLGPLLFNWLARGAGADSVARDAREHFDSRVAFIASFYAAPPELVHALQATLSGPNQAMAVATGATWANVMTDCGFWTLAYQGWKSLFGSDEPTCSDEASAKVTAVMRGWYEILDRLVSLTLTAGAALAGALGPERQREALTPPPATAMGELVITAARIDRGDLPREALLSPEYRRVDGALINSVFRNVVFRARGFAGIDESALVVAIGSPDKAWVDLLPRETPAGRRIGGAVPGIFDIVGDTTGLALFGKTSWVDPATQLPNRLIWTARLYYSVNTMLLACEGGATIDSGHGFGGPQWFYGFEQAPGTGMADASVQRLLAMGYGVPPPRVETSEARALRLAAEAEFRAWEARVSGPAAATSSSGGGLGSAVGWIVENGTKVALGVQIGKIVGSLLRKGR